MRGTPRWRPVSHPVFDVMRTRAQRASDHHHANPMTSPPAVSTASARVILVRNWASDRPGCLLTPMMQSSVAAFTNDPSDLLHRLINVLHRECEREAAESAPNPDALLTSDEVHPGPYGIKTY